MTDGAALVGALVYGMKAAGLWSGGRGGNLLDGGDPLYGCYRCADGKYLALGALEPQFRAALLEGLGLDAPDGIAERIATRTREEWVTHLSGRDACVAPVLSMEEAPHHPHHVARSSFGEVGGVVQPMPVPRFSATPAARPTPPRSEGQDGEAILAELGYGAAEIEQLLEGP